MEFFEPLYLWLDDTRPAPSGWRWAPTFGKAKALVGLSLQSPGRRYELKRLSFDHDLGDGLIVEWARREDDGSMYASQKKRVLTGYDLAKDILEYATLGLLPPFAWRVHSMNPVGAQNIRFVMAQVEAIWVHQEWPDWPEVV